MTLTYIEEKEIELRNRIEDLKQQSHDSQDDKEMQEFYESEIEKCERELNNLDTFEERYMEDLREIMDTIEDLNNSQK